MSSVLHRPACLSMRRTALVAALVLCAVLAAPAAAHAATVDLGVTASTASPSYSPRVSEDGASSSEIDLVVTNDAVATASAGGTLTITLDSHLEAVAAPSFTAGGTCSGSDPYTCTLPQLADGATSTVVMLVESSGQGGTASAPVTGSVAPAGGDTDSNPTNNTASTPLAVGTYSDTQLGFESATSTHLVGDSFTVANTFSNQSIYASDSATAVTIQGDPGLSFVDGTVRPQVTGSVLSGGSGPSVACTVSADHTTVTCPVGAMTGASRGDLTLQGTVTGVGSLHVTETLTDADTAASTAARTQVSTITAATPTYGATDASITGDQGVLTVASGNDPGLAWTVTDNGTNSSSGGIVTVSLPAAAMHVRVATWQDRNGVVHDCAVVTDGFACHIGILGPGASSAIQLSGYALAVGSYPFSATFVPNESDPNLANDTVSGRLSVIDGPPTNLVVTLATSTPSIALPGNAVFTAHVVNEGTVDAQDVVLASTLPAGATLVSSSGTVSPCSASLGVISCTVDPLSAGAAVDISYTIAMTVGGTITDGVTVSSGNTDTAPADNAASVSVTGTYAAPKGSITHSVAVKYATAAKAIVESFTVSQAGKAKVTATIPAASARILHIPALVASGSGSAAKAGTGSYTLKLGSNAKKRLAKLRRFTIAVTLTFTSSASGKTVVLHQNVTITNAAIR